jgi:Uma2 family endonuclease
MGAELRGQFRGRSCRVYTNDMRVGTVPSGLYFYPDVVAVCGPEEIADDEADTLLNPTVIFEVLSPSTEGHDRGAKFIQYQRFTSLTDYVLVAQDQVRVDHFTRQGEGWFLRAFTSLADTLHLDSLGAALPLAAIYEDVEFTTASAPSL